MVHSKRNLVVPFSWVSIINFDQGEKLARGIEHNLTTKTRLLQNVYTGQWCGGGLDSFSFTPINSYRMAVLGDQDWWQKLGQLGILYFTIG